MSTLSRKAFHVEISEKHEHVAQKAIVQDRRGAALLTVTEAAPKSLFSFVNRSPVWYDFRAGTRAIRYSVVTALKLFS